MNCKYCGQMIEENVSFCPHCGKSVKEESAKEQDHAYETAPAAAPVHAPAVPGTEQKSRVVAGLMGILFGLFLGGLGIHNFYLGYTKKAVTQLLICILGACLVVGPLVSGIWCLVDGIRIIAGDINVDANGVPLKD